MSCIVIPEGLLRLMEAHGELSYPAEGAGFLLGRTGMVMDILPIGNARENEARHNRYLFTPADYAHAEDSAAQRGLDLIGVFHSHPDHPSRPSDFDREWAQPFFSYIITSINKGAAAGSRSWRLEEDRSRFIEEEIEIKHQNSA